MISRFTISAPRATGGSLLIMLGGVGCTTTATYKPEYVRHAPVAEDRRVEGKVLLCMNRADVAYVFKGHPTGFVGSARTLSLPLGAMTQEIGKTVFADFFSEGVDTAESFNGVAGHRAAVQIAVHSFSYAFADAFSDPKPRVDIQLQVKFLDGASSAVWEKLYSSGEVQGDTFPVFSASLEPYNKLTHETLRDLLRRAAMELRSYLYSHPVERVGGST